MEKKEKMMSKFSSELSKLELGSLTGGDTIFHSTTYTTGYTAYTSTGMPTTVWDVGHEGMSGSSGSW